MVNETTLFALPFFSKSFCSALRVSKSVMISADVDKSSSDVVFCSSKAAGVVKAGASLLLTGFCI